MLPSSCPLLAAPMPTVGLSDLCPSRPPEGTLHPGVDQERGNPPMRVPVVDVRGIPVMPCTPPKARALLTAGKARPKRNKLGIFYLPLSYEQAPDNQPLVRRLAPPSPSAAVTAFGPTS